MCLVRIATLLAVVAHATSVDVGMRREAVRQNAVRDVPAADPAAPVTPAAVAPKQKGVHGKNAKNHKEMQVDHVDRTDLKYTYSDEMLPGACEAHYEFLGDLSNDQCAHECFKTKGCTRFSAGGCNAGCRISVANRNNVVAGETIEKAPDGQCITKLTGSVDAGDCIVYSLTFFQLTHSPGYCSTGYKMIEDAENKADCAHACKSTPGCLSFSTEPNCMRGCRVSTGGTPTTQCIIDEEKGCTAYSMTQPKEDAVLGEEAPAEEAPAKEEPAEKVPAEEAPGSDPAVPVTAQ